ncbi:hypothetical protein DL96DRAFT_1592124 [Flagelloscypha sp. PMI_526]|nr:hypothetical protein DL96DRAFT_1592124 [Flagelloscypha sp. PMI_526]
MYSILYPSSLLNQTGALSQKSWPLPPEILLRVLIFSRLQEILAFRQTSKSSYTLSCDFLLWKGWVGRQLSDQGLQLEHFSCHPDYSLPSLEQVGAELVQQSRPLSQDFTALGSASENSFVFKNDASFYSIRHLKLVYGGRYLVAANSNTIFGWELPNVLSSGVSRLIFSTSLPPSPNSSEIEDLSAFPLSQPPTSTTSGVWIQVNVFTTSPAMFAYRIDIGSQPILHLSPAYSLPCPSQRPICDNRWVSWESRRQENVWILDTTLQQVWHVLVPNLVQPRKHLVYDGCLASLYVNEANGERIGIYTLPSGTQLEENVGNWWNDIPSTMLAPASSRELPECHPSNPFYYLRKTGESSLIIVSGTPSGTSDRSPQHLNPLASLYDINVVEGTLVDRGPIRKFSELGPMGFFCIAQEAMQHSLVAHDRIRRVACAVKGMVSVVHIELGEDAPSIIIQTRKEREELIVDVDSFSGRSVHLSLDNTRGTAAMRISEFQKESKGRSALGIELMRKFAQLMRG